MTSQGSTRRPALLPPGGVVGIGLLGFGVVMACPCRHRAPGAGPMPPVRAPVAGPGAPRP